MQRSYPAPTSVLGSPGQKEIINQRQISKAIASHVLTRASSLQRLFTEYSGSKNSSAIKNSSAVKLFLFSLSSVLNSESSFAPQWHLRISSTVQKYTPFNGEIRHIISLLKRQSKSSFIDLKKLVTCFSKLLTCFLLFLQSKSSINNPKPIHRRIFP